MRLAVFCVYVFVIHGTCAGKYREGTFVTFVSFCKRFFGDFCKFNSSISRTFVS